MSIDFPSLKRPCRLWGCALSTGLLLACSSSSDPRTVDDTDFKTIELSTLEDKIRGGWAGQMIGVSYGAPTEFQYLGELVPEDRLVEWTPELVGNALDQDDLYVDITLAGVLDEHGLDATTEDFGAFLREARYSLWHANLAARRALRRGVPATETGKPEHNAHANDIDFQIEADFIGLMTPGLPQASNEICERAGRVMNTGDGIYGGMFISAMYSAAFFESNPRRLVEAGLAVLPAESPYALLISDVLAWSEEHHDWTQVWQLIEDKWSQREPCPEGALAPFNIDAKLNGAYVALGLLYGDGDFERTMRVATRAGQDSDCNPASAAGVLGVVLGFDGIPHRYTSGFNDIADENFSYTDATFRTIVEDTLHRSIAMVERHGGKLSGEILEVQTQSAVPARLEIWDDYGDPVERVPTGDARWVWKGDWQERSIEKWGRKFTGWSSSVGESEGTIRFAGTGAIVVGWFLPTGGMADVYLDGEWVKTVDTYPDEDDVKFNEAIWHAFGLEDAEHEVRLIVRGEPYAESHGAEITLTDLVIFR
jgi:hypothetical protein